jgi:hypothetical protein
MDTQECRRIEVPYSLVKKEIEQKLFLKDISYGEYLNMNQENELEKEKAAAEFFPAFEQAEKERDVELMMGLLQSFDKFIDESFEHKYEDGIWCYLPNPPPLSKIDEIYGQIKYRSLLNHMSLLQKAVISGQSFMVKFLILNGAYPDSCGGYYGGYYEDDEVGEIGITALIYCVLRDRRGMFQLLLKEGADINGNDSEGQTALHHSIKDHGVYTWWFDEIIAFGADVNKQDGGFKSPMCVAICEGRFDMVARILENGADLDVMQGINRTVTLLHVACIYANYEIVLLLIQRGAKVLAKTDPCLQWREPPSHTYTPMEFMLVFSKHVETYDDIRAMLLGIGGPPLHEIGPGFIKILSFLEFIEKGLAERGIEVQKQRDTAFMMSFIPRLGEGSKSAALDPGFAHSMILRPGGIEPKPHELDRRDLVETTAKLVDEWVREND